jgi:anti-anti-sigma factor
MEIETSAQDGVSIVRVVGYLDTRASSEFERKMLELLQGGTRAFALDFSRLDMLTSAGIRILLMIAKRIGGTDRIALWGLNEQVKVVFSIAGLANAFQFFDSQQAAVERVQAPAAPDAASATQLSRMARLAMRLLGETGAPPPRTIAGQGESVSKMTEQVSQLLKKRTRAGEDVKS